MPMVLEEQARLMGCVPVLYREIVWLICLTQVLSNTTGVLILCF